jgi:putative flippase GtrA
MIGDKTAPDLPMLRDDEPATLPQLDGLRALLRLTEPVTYPPRLPAAVSPVSRRGSHRAQVPAQTHWRRLGTYGLIGAVVFLAGVGLQVGLVRLAGMSHLASYAIQTAVSIQLSYLLNRLITWRDRDVAPSSWLRFGFQQAIVQGLGVAGYAGLTRIGVEYVAANIAVTAVLAPAGYASSHLWSMTDRREWWRVFTRGPWPLMGVLTVQAALSLRLIWSNTAFMDEALYLSAGRWELTHLFYGAGIPQYQTYFSGAPVIYPVIAAIADGYGGLAAARMVSCAFMLAATGFCYGTASLLAGRRAALAAAAVFAALGSVEFLGAFATYDAMALCLLAASAFLVVRASGRISEPLLILAALVLTTADATKYATALWDPVVIGLVILTAERGGRLAAAMRGIRFAAYLAGMIAVGLRIAGVSYMQGIMYTTVQRRAGGEVGPAWLVAKDTSSWIGPVLLIAAVAVAAAWREGPRSRWLYALLLVAGLLAPVHQAQIHIITSLHKHVAFGAWFAAIGAGYVLARASRVNLRKGWRVIAVSAGLVAFTGIPQASAQMSDWPDAAAMTAVMARLVPETGCPCLAMESNVTGYYLTGSDPSEFTGAYYFAWRDPQGAMLTGFPAYAAAIAHGYFKVAEVDPDEGSAVYETISRALERNPAYHLAWSERVPWGYMQVWKR